ncbi:N-acetylmuramoyl-L-alanine amidase [Paenibacillus sinopodophylli]|uniref:N-acetylmuramoyl-L-alanine amidase n=1 Tax=Paenibacillus sinopodophylli TaxID=1837342 RepID=UPI00110C953A|nr:peptidoglycan recognition family protein [Paenibacillus sinopodophylli]
MEIIEKLVPSFNERNGQKPIIIVNHISVGSMGSMYNTFANKNNKASSHFGVGRDGTIVQYVPINKSAWTQGKIQLPTAPIIKQIGGDPNKYGVSIEHEGYAGNGLDGNLTGEQFLATCWIHKHIQTAVEAEYGVRIPLNSHQVLGHYQIDSKGKPFCPGLAFPWGRLYAELAIADTMTLEQYEERITYNSSQAADRTIAYAFAERIQDLKSKFADPRWGVPAKSKVMMMAPVIYQMGYAEDKEVTPEGIAQRVLELHNNSAIEKYRDSGFKKLLIGAKRAKEVGLL